MSFSDTDLLKTLKDYQKDTHKPGRWHFQMPNSGVFFAISSTLDIPVEVEGYKLLKGAKRTGSLILITSEMIILRFQKLARDVAHEIYYEPFDTLYGERMTDDGEFGLFIPEATLNKIKAFGKAKEPKLEYPKE